MNFESVRDDLKRQLSAIEAFVKEFSRPEIRSFEKIDGGELVDVTQKRLEFYESTADELRRVITEFDAAIEGRDANRN